MYEQGDTRKLHQARTFIQQKQYDKARAILQAMPDNPTARDWLTRLNTRYPASRPAQSAVPESISKSKTSIYMDTVGTRKPSLPDSIPLTQLIPLLVQRYSLPAGNYQLRKFVSNKPVDPRLTLKDLKLKDYEALVLESENPDFPSQIRGLSKPEAELQSSQNENSLLENVLITGCGMIMFLGIILGALAFVNATGLLEEIQALFDPNHQIVGMWNNTESMVSERLELREDKTFEWHGPLSDGDGNYTFEDNTLTLHYPNGQTSQFDVLELSLTTMKTRSRSGTTVWQKID